MCMCLTRGGMGGERIGFGRYQSCGNRGSVCRVSSLGCGGVCREWVGAWTRVYMGGVVSCLCESGLTV